MFLEERFPLTIDTGSAFDSRFAVQEVVTAGGYDYRWLRHPYPQMRYEMGLGGRMDDWMIETILDLYQRCGGRFGGFRVKNQADFSTNNYRGAPTAADQLCTAISTAAGTYQLMRWYGDSSIATTPRRRLRKPVAGSVLVGVKAANGVTYPITAFTADNTTGVVTLSANKQRSITGITQAAQAVATVGSGHGYIIGDSAVFSGVVGMVEINGLRASVVGTSSTTITVGINSTGFTPYTSGGQVNTRPQSGESVMGGCYFDIPVRFETDMAGMAFRGGRVMGLDSPVVVVELLNP